MHEWVPTDASICSMARNMGNDTHQHKKQKVTHGASSSHKRTAGPLSKAQKRRIVRRISSHSSSTEGRNAPTFHQPGCSPSPGRDLGRPAARRPRDLYEDEDGEGEDDSEVTALKHLEKLPTDQRYTAIGKMFVLKIWPWAPPVWWIGDEEAIEAPEEAARYLSKRKELALRREKLETKKKHEFRGFLAVDMGISADEWMKPRFQSQVISYVLVVEWSFDNFLVSTRDTLTSV